MIHARGDIARDQEAHNQCGHEFGRFEKESQHCPKCGVKRIRSDRCQKCGRPKDNSDMFCPGCGQ